MTVDERLRKWHRGSLRAVTWEWVHIDPCSAALPGVPSAQPLLSPRSIGAENNRLPCVVVRRMADSATLPPFKVWNTPDPASCGQQKSGQL